MSEFKNVRIVTPVGKLAFHKNLFKANDKGRYTCAVVFEKDQAEALAPVKELISNLINEKWPNKKPSDLRTPIKLEDRDEMLEKYPFMADRITMNASNGFEVSVIDIANQEMFEGDIQAGDEVRLSISGYAYDNQTKGVGLNVNAVQFIRKGEPFYSKATASSMFADAAPVEGAETASQASTTNTEESKSEGSFDSFGF